LQVEGAFSQPNGGMCEKMLTWAKKVTRGSSEHDMLELYCGNGNFTIALAPNFRSTPLTSLNLQRLLEIPEKQCDPC
jgi:tRNA (uracil-5-)-methyltransferase